VTIEKLERIAVVVFILTACGIGVSFFAVFYYTLFTVLGGI